MKAARYMDLGESSIKSTRLEEVDMSLNLELLNKWTIPKLDTKLIYDSDEHVIRLLNKQDVDLYKTKYNWMHIGMVQIAFKPLTLKGLLETF